MIRYAINYDVGDRTRSAGGVNEDSVVVSTFTDGHREGYVPEERDGGGRFPDGASTPPSPESGPAESEVATDTSGRRDGSTPPSSPASRSLAVVVLADGAGGHAAGDAASYLATTVVAAELTPVVHRIARAEPAGFGVSLPDRVRPDSPDGAARRAAVADAVGSAHEAVVRYAAEADVSAYTTVVAGLYDGRRIHCGWVGDSRAYVVNGASEQIARVTRDHSSVADERRSGNMDAVEAAVHPRGNEITRALGGRAGADDRVAVDTTTVPLFAEDVVVVTSDGLVDAQTDAQLLFEAYRQSDRSDEAADAVREAIVTDETVRNAVLDAETLDAAARECVRLANRMGGKDNVSLALLADEALPATPDDGPPDRTFDPDGTGETLTVGGG